MNQAPTKKTIPNSLSEKKQPVPFFCPLRACMFLYYFKLSEKDHMSLYSLI